MAMNSTFITTHVSRTSRNLLIWNGLVVALLLAIILPFGGPYYVNFFRGPIPVDDAYLLQAAKHSDSGLIAYVELADRPLLPTGWKELSLQDERVYSTTPYFYVAVDDKLLLVKTDPERDGHRLVGPLQGIHVKTDVEVRDALVAAHPELKDRLLPIMLNGAAAFTVAGYVGLALFIPAFLLCGFNIARALWGLNFPPLHPIARTLARYGEPQQIAAQIDKEVAEGPATTIGPVTVTSLWLLRPTVFGLVACPLSEVVWAYHLVFNGSHMAVVYLRNGRNFGVPLKAAVVPQLLQEIYARIPWVERGCDNATLKRWRTQRQEFLADIERRRGELCRGT